MKKSERKLRIRSSLSPLFYALFWADLGYVFSPETTANRSVNEFTYKPICEKHKKLRLNFLGEYVKDTKELLTGILRCGDVYPKLIHRLIITCNKHIIHKEKKLPNALYTNLTCYRNKCRRWRRSCRRCCYLWWICTIDGKLGLTSLRSGGTGWGWKQDCRHRSRDRVRWDGHLWRENGQWRFKIKDMDYFPYWRPEISIWVSTPKPNSHQTLHLLRIKFCT